MTGIPVYIGSVTIHDDSPTTATVVGQFTETLNRHGIETSTRHAAHDTIVFIDGQTNWPGVEGALTMLMRATRDNGHDMNGAVTRSGPPAPGEWRCEDGRVRSNMGDTLVYTDMYDLLHGILPTPMPDNLTLRFTGRANGEQWEVRRRELDMDCTKNLARTIVIPEHPNRNLTDAMNHGEGDTPEERVASNIIDRWLHIEYDRALELCLDAWLTVEIVNAPINLTAVAMRRAGE